MERTSPIRFGGGRDERPKNFLDAMRFLPGQRQRKPEEDARELASRRNKSQIGERGRKFLELLPLTVRDRNLDAPGRALEGWPSPVGSQSVQKLRPNLECGYWPSLAFQSQPRIFGTEGLSDAGGINARRCWAQITNALGGCLHQHWQFKILTAAVYLPAPLVDANICNKMS